MTAVELAAPPANPRTPDFAKWRARSRLIHALRVVFPALIGLIFAFLVTEVLIRTISGAKIQPAETNAPIRLVKPRFVGRDAKGRAFVLTAATAVRDEKDYQRVLLDTPMLVLDEEGPNPARLSAASGVYREDDGILHLKGGVKLNGQDVNFKTATSVFNTATGEVEGSGEISGVGSAGEIIAKSYGVYDKGDRMVFKGGVQAHINPK
jgi:lipopolysaccharide export system protein LptC